jgi:multiple sugar transport system ATP-binding protein
MPATEIKQKVERAAGILGLEKLLDRFPRQLSGGQRQRVAMGRAIVRDPSVFLFDEPLSNLDAKLRVQMRTEIKALHQRLKTTTVYVTHDQIEAMTMADKIVVMRDGVIEQMGAPLELYDRPANLFVAGFIGSPSMNFIAGELEAGGFRTRDGILLPLVKPNAKAATYGIRPEHLHLDPNGLDIEVVVVEPMGSETQVVARLGSQQIVVVFRERIDAAPGARIKVSPDLSVVHLFDKDGIRLG